MLGCALAFETVCYVFWFGFVGWWFLVFKPDLNCSVGGFEFGVALRFGVCVVTWYVVMA